MAKKPLKKTPSKKMVPPSKATEASPRILSAEGWKRLMMKKHRP